MSNDLNTTPTDVAADFQSRRMTRDEVADLLGIRANSITAAIGRGQLKLTKWKVGRRVYFDRAEVETFISNAMQGR